MFRPSCRTGEPLDAAAHCGTPPTLESKTPRAPSPAGSSLKAYPTHHSGRSPILLSVFRPAHGMQRIPASASAGPGPGASPESAGLSKTGAFAHVPAARLSQNAGLSKADSFRLSGNAGLSKDYVSKRGVVEKSGAPRFRHPRIFGHGRAFSLQGGLGFRQPRIPGHREAGSRWANASLVVASAPVPSARPAHARWAACQRWFSGEPLKTPH
jgi:hypothetical protein